MLLLDEIAEARIREAQARGEFDQLPGHGKPLQLDDDALIPEDLRLAYRVLKNAGYVPPQIDCRRELHGIGQLLACVQPEDEPRQRRRARYLLTRLNFASGRDGAMWLQDDYYRKLCTHFDRGGKAGEPG